MTILLLDIGNHRLKWNTCEELTLQSQTQWFAWRQSDSRVYFEQYWKNLPPLAAVWISSVAGNAFNQVVSQWLTHNTGLTPQFAHVQKKHQGIINGYLQPEQLGVDRWLAIIAARQLAQSITGQAENDLCVIDCGTAMTLDVLEASGRHLGGLIAPGLGLMRESLELAPGITIKTVFDVNLLARNTSDGVYNGTLSMAVAFVVNTVAQIEQQLERPLLKILTGGDGEVLSPYLPKQYHYEADLVLHGLAQFAKSL